MSVRRTTGGARVYEPDGLVLTAYLWDRSRVCVIRGPIGSGTSTCSCHRVWLLACEQLADSDGVRRTRWIVSRQTYKELRDTTVKTWLMWFPEAEWGPMIRAEPMYHNLRREHPSGDGTFVDCEVIFLALPDTSTAVAALASYEITGAFGNEVQFWEKGVVDELLSRCSRYPSLMGGPGATWYGFFGDMNAPTEGHWIPYMAGDVPLPADLTDEERREYEMPDDWRFLVQPPGLLERRGADGRIEYLENPDAENQKWLTERYLDKVIGKPRAWIDQRVQNRIGLYVQGKAVYPTFNEADHVLKVDVPAKEGRTLIVGLDFGREPAAVFLQDVGGTWTVLDELIGDGESAEIFAPRVKRRLAQRFPGLACDFWGDPRGADKGQNAEITAYDIFMAHGMRVMPATSDNNVQMRRSTVERVLGRLNGFAVNPSCMILKVGLAGGYHYPKIAARGVAGLYSEKPRKNRYSHAVEALENGLMGGGESSALVVSAARPRAQPSPVVRRRLTFRRLGQ